MVRAVILITAFSATLLPAADRYRITTANGKGPDAPPLVVLHDETGGLRAAIAPSQGGELAGLEIRFGARWLEILHRARDYNPVDGFAGRAPFLWPATGRNFVDPSGGERRESGLAYQWNGRRYPIPIHGFASGMPWREVSTSAAEQRAQLVLAISDTPETRAQYPFGFEIQAAYLLADGELGITYTVKAAAENRAPMPFSIGNHITFVMPLVPGSEPGETLIETPSTIEYLKDPPGIPTGEARPLSYRTPTPVSELPRLSAVSLGGYGAEPYLVLTDPQGLSIRISHNPQSIPDEPVILFNLWGDPASGFFSPEPWVGLQNSLNRKQGLVELSPGQEWVWTIRIQPRIRPVP